MTWCRLVHRAWAIGKMVRNATGTRAGRIQGAGKRLIVHMLLEPRCTEPAAALGGRRHKE